MTEVPGRDREERELLAAAFLERTLRRARVDPNAFAEYVFLDERGKPIVQEWFHREWQDTYTDHDRVVIFSCVEHGKSTQSSIIRPAFELGRAPTSHGAIISDTATQASKLLGAIKTNIESNSRLHEVFPHLQRENFRSWRDDAIRYESDEPTTEKDFTIQALGLGGALMGARLNWIILDDVLNFENTSTEEQCQKTIEWYQTTVLTRALEGCRIWVNGNAWSPFDLMHWLEKQGTFRVARYPAAIPRVDWESRTRTTFEGDLFRDKVPLWPSRWPASRLEEREKQLTAFRFNQLFMCQAVDEARTPFTDGTIEKAKLRGRNLPFAPSDWDRPCFTGVDLATGQTKRHAYTVFFTLGLTEDGSRYVLDIQSGRWHASQIEQVAAMVYEKYGSIFMVENNACLPAGSRVLTSRGYLLIEDIEIGESVLTHKGRWRPVLHTTCREIDGELIEIRPSGGLPFRCTPEHGIRAMESGRSPGKYPKGGYHRPIGDPDWIPAVHIRGGKNGDAHYLLTPSPDWPRVAPRLQLVDYGKPRSIEVTEEVALFLGLYMAEGGGGSPSQACLTMNENERHLFAFVSDIAGRVLDATTSERSGEGKARTVTINSTALKRVLSVYGVGPSKCPPWCWMGWPLHLRIALVRGWFLGDGSYDLNNASTKWPRKRLRGVTISRDWAAWARYTMIEAGLRPTIDRQVRKATKIDGRRIRRRPIHQIALNVEDTEKILTSITPVEWSHWRSVEVAGNRSNSTIVPGKHGIWSKVRSVSRVDYTGPVYNLEVEEDESFVVEDTVVHNSQEFMVQFIRRDLGIPVHAFTTGRQKSHPEFGIESLAVEMAQGQWIVPNVDGIVHPFVQKWLNECAGYVPQAHTGDHLMASFFAREALRRFERRGRTVAVRLIGDRDNRRTR